MDLVLAFVKKAWNTIKQDLFLFFQKFYINSKLAKEINSIFVALIPIIDGASNFREFRPISMVGWLYKLLAKVLANRSKIAIPFLIGGTQAACMGGRHILDGVLIANKIIVDWNKRRSQSLILKLDFEKVCDCVHWPFLLKTPANKGCGDRWIKWIKECFSTTTLSILINGSPSSKIPMERGHRQRDPISSLLFNAVVEGLNIMFERARSLVLIYGVKIGVKRSYYFSSIVCRRHHYFL